MSSGKYCPPRIRQILSLINKSYFRGEKSKTTAPLKTTEDILMKLYDSDEDISGVSDDSTGDPSFTLEGCENQENSDSEVEGTSTNKRGEKRKYKLPPAVNNNNDTREEGTSDEDGQGDDAEEPGGVREGEEEMIVSVMPTFEGGYTDEDSDNEEEPTGDGRHLPRVLLAGAGQAELVKAGPSRQKRRKQVAGGKKTAKKRGVSRAGDMTASEDEEDDGVEEVVVAAAGPAPVGPETWQKDDPKLVGTRIPQYQKPDETLQYTEKLEGAKTALDFYNLFQPKHFTNQVVYQSKLYAVSRGWDNKVDVITVDNMKCLEAFLLHTGYHQVPRRRMVWELSGDCHNPFIADNIRRDTLENILQCLHFRDNSKVDDDIYFKVRLVLGRNYFLFIICFISF